MFITVEELEDYTNVRGDAMAPSYIKSACEIVRNYLGYNPEETEYDNVYDGTGSSVLFLESQNISEVTEVTFGGTSQDLSQFFIKQNAIMMKSGEFPLGMQNITVHYVGGWTSENMPEVIKTTALQIAALRQAESDGNVAVSSKSFGDSGTRVFLSTRNYSQFLFNISAYKLF